jgi:diguanylate cyclase (GGDEF)-like protein
VRLAINISEHKLLEEKLKKLTELDDLTGAYNRRFFLQCMKNETEIARRRSQDLSLIILDADYFKKINDKHGHAQGDRALQHLSRTISRHLRSGNIFARIGGEEFAILCPSTGQQEALDLAERLCQLVATTPLDLDQDRIALTISLGVTALRDSDTRIEQLLIRADQALYTAKHNGRNQACCYSAAAATMRCVQ